mgnify:CR=1 FL=1
MNGSRYVDPKGHVWVAPASSVVDGASIPRSLWTFMGGPFEGKYRNASVLHDVADDQKNRPREDCAQIRSKERSERRVAAVAMKLRVYDTGGFGRPCQY